MAHFAKLGINGKVIQVVALSNNDMLNADGVEDETVGQQYLENNHHWSAQLWIQTSYNTANNTHSNGGTALRGNYAGIGDTWDEDNQIFWSKKPYPSWVKDLTSASWKSPIGDAPTLTVSQLNANIRYIWNEDNQNWDLYIWNEDNQNWDLTTV
tara:strand:- start:1412 stop:1873 length:462 start_codon:yes stop_codon:yes gene_type:complete